MLALRSAFTAPHMSVVSVRVPKELRERMDRFRDRVDWGEEIRRFLEERVRELEREEALKRVEELLRELPTQPRGSISELVREGRDSH